MNFICINSLPTLAINCIFIIYEYFSSISEDVLITNYSGKMFTPSYCSKHNCSSVTHYLAHDNYNLLCYFIIKLTTFLFQYNYLRILAYYYVKFDIIIEPFKRILPNMTVFSEKNDLSNYSILVI